MSRWVSLNQARAKASLNASWSSRNFSLICAELGVELERHVGGGHHRRDLLAGVPGRRGLVLFLLVDRLPLLRAGGRLHQLVVIVEQQAEIVLAPFGRGVDPRAFDAAGHGVLADAAALLAADPAEALRGEIAARRGLRRAVDGVAVAVRLAEGVAAGGERDGLLVVHRHALRRSPSCRAPTASGVGVAARAFGIDVDQAHLDRGERAFELVHAVLGAMRVCTPWLTHLSSEPQ